VCEEQQVVGIWQGLCEGAGAGNLAYAAWKGEPGDERLFFSIFDGQGWHGQGNIIPGNSSTGPGLTFFDGVVVAAWKGELNDSRLFYSSYDPNVGAWVPQIYVTNVQSDIGPSLVGIANVIYAGFIGANGDTALYFASFVPGDSQWQLLPPIPEVSGQPWVTQSAYGPSLAAVGATCYAAWTDLKGLLYYAAFDTLTGVWTSPAVMRNHRSSVGPSLAAVDTTLYAAWIGRGNDQTIQYDSLDTTAATPQWTGQNVLNAPGSSIGPALAASGETVYAVWVGVGDDVSMYYATLDTSTPGASWNGSPPMGGNTGQDYVPPPTGGLIGNSNYVIAAADGGNITGLVVTIVINKDIIVPNNGFDFQLNCNAPLGGDLRSVLQWQQFVTGFDPTDNQIGCSMELFHFAPGAPMGGSVYNPQWLLCPVSDVSPIASYTLPAGSQYTIKLLDDGTNITGAEFTFQSPSGPFPPPPPHTFDIPTNLTAGSGTATPTPIVSFELVVTGINDRQATTLAQGSGTITYTADTQLIALPTAPQTSDFTQTAENSNAFYTGLPSGPATTMQHQFGVQQSNTN
jgi:hypothetical protein